MALNSFNVYHSYLQSLEPLNDSERGRLFTAMLEYSITGKCPELRGNERFIFPSFAAQIDRDREKYTKKCEKNSQNAQKRLQAIASERKRTQAIASEISQGQGQGQGQGEKDNISLIVKAYEDSIGLMPQYVVDSACAFIRDGLEPGLVVRAIQIAAENNVRKWSYVSAILRDCEQRGIWTLREFDVERRKRNDESDASACTTGSAESLSLGEHF